jgi:hypothetical protein
MLPAAPAGAAGAAIAETARGARPPAHRRRIAVRMSIRIPRRGRHKRRGMHPATISALTQSVGIAIDGGAQQSFDTTPSSPGCSIGAGGLTCTFSVKAAVGTDTFVVTTYSGAGGTGTALDRGVATVPIASGKANMVPVTLGPVVTTTADAGIGSLRYAIGSASPGDTIMFLLPAGSTIALASPIAISGTVALAGPGAGSLTIGGGNAHQIFLVTGTASISGLTLSQGRAATPNAPGGAIWNAGTLVLANDTIGTSTSIVSIERAPGKRRAPSLRRHPHCAPTYAYGGALYNAGSLTMTGTTFTGNSVQSDVAGCLDGEGGAIFNDLAGTVSSSGDTFTNNSALAGGAVYNAGLGSVSFANDTFTGNTGCTAASGCPTTACGNSGCTSNAQGSGAAIYDAGTGITVASSTFTNNVAGGATNGSLGMGGALYLSSGTPTIAGSAFAGNLAGGGTASCSSGEGGAIAATTPLVLDDDTFTNNRAIGDQSSAGGAVVDTVDVQGTGDAFTSNVATGSGSACSTASTGAGGALFSQGTVTLSNSSFAKNAATGNADGGGGGIACNNCTLSGDTFTSNSALGTGDVGATSTAGGGGIYVESTGKVTRCTFASNGATVEGANAQYAYGGGIVDISGSLVSSGNTYTSNAAAESTGTGTVAGGGLTVVSGAAVSSGDTFTSNAATGSNVTGGGGAYLVGAYVLTGATFSGNNATGLQATGGALAVGVGGQISNSTFVSNDANGSGGIGAGGAVFDTGGSTVNDSTFEQNVANASAGALYLVNAETISGSLITGNSVTQATQQHAGGGGIYSTSTITVTRTTISNNAVTVSGAGQSGGGGVFNEGGMTLTQSTLSGNAVLGSAPSSGGGGIYDDADAQLTNDTISGNDSKLDGGGIEIGSNHTVALANVTLYKNSAAGSGGNVDNRFAMKLTNSIVGGGAAATGADIHNAGTLTSGDYDVIQTAPAGNALAGTTTHNKTADPLLLGLANNGGPTYTNADRADSPGTASIPFAANSCGSVALSVDQRGYTRGAGGRCDAGAFEYGGVPSAARHPAPVARAAPHAPHGGLPLRPLRIVPVELRIPQP